MTRDAFSEGDRTYAYADGNLGYAHSYLLPALSKVLDSANPRRVFDLGCGNGAVADWIRRRGIEVTGIDYSESGVAEARKFYPGIRIEEGSVYEDLSGRFGHFPFVISLEVVEHLYDPRRYAAVVHDLLEPGGVAFISTPYHGYFKNLMLALSGRMDAHFTVLWDGGHIKFWSISTLGLLLREAGFKDLQFQRVGRIPPLAKSMIVLARKPAA